MPDRVRSERKAEGRLRRYEEERLMLEKRSEEYDVFEEVFDRPTLEGVYKLIHKKVINRIHGVVKAGKEARIYWAESPEGAELAVKIYYTTASEFRKGMMMYIEGDPRFQRVRRDTRGLIYTWAQKEFSNLKLAEGAGVNVPRPIEFYRNILVMSFIGEDGVPAPLLREVSPANPDGFYSQLLHEVRLLYTRAGLVHGDLSEYNIMVWDETPVIFDISQAVLIAHPMSDVLLLRDIERVNTYFARLGACVIRTEAAERWVKGGEKDIS